MLGTIAEYVPCIPPIPSTRAKEIMSRTTDTSAVMCCRIQRLAFENSRFSQITLSGSGALTTLVIRHSGWERGRLLTDYGRGQFLHPQLGCASCHSIGLESMCVPICRKSCKGLVQKTKQASQQIAGEWLRERANGYNVFCFT